MAAFHRGVHALGPLEDLELVYGECVDGGPERDFEIVESMVETSFTLWKRERQAADALLDAYPSIDALGTGNRHSVRWNLQKLIDGTTGEW